MKGTKLKVAFNLSDIQSKSGRKYDIASMKDALERYKENLGDGCTALGELAHAPSEPDLRKQPFVREPCCKYDERLAYRGKRINGR